MHVNIEKYLEDYRVQLGFEFDGVTCSMVFNLSDLQMLKHIANTAQIKFEEERKNIEKWEKACLGQRSVKVKCACGYVNLIPSLSVFEAFDKLKCEKCDEVIAYSEKSY